MSQDHVIQQHFSVDYRFDLRFTHDAFALENESLLAVLGPSGRRPARALVCIDAGLAAAQPDLERRIHRWFAAQDPARLQLAASPEIVPGGEAAKRDFSVVERVGRLCLEHGLCRHSYVLAIGGGAVLDAVGLGAALVHRGLRLVRLPSTVLAQNDAGLGVKNGINAFGNKNFFGCFAPPYAVIDDSALLRSLDDRQWRAGISEAVKVAAIKDADFLSWIVGNAETFARRDGAAMDTLVRRCAQLHLEHIAQGGDPFETGSSRPLDFGHWSAHRIEVLSKHRIGHGEAVAIGLALDLCYARELGRISAAQCALILDALETIGFRLYDEVLELRDRDGHRSVLQGLQQFREHLGGELTLAMPDGLGQRRDIHDFDEACFERCLRELRRRSPSRRFVQR